MRYMLVVLMFALVGCAELPVRNSPAVVIEEEAVPADISIASITARSTLIPLGLQSDGTVDVPSVKTPMQAGYLNWAPEMGNRPLIVLGHVDGGGKPGIFFKLKDVKSGDIVEIQLDNGQTMNYEIYDVQQVDKDQFPTERIYSPTPTPEIRLITCGGVFDRGERSYEDNIIALGRLWDDGV